jgi:hypothetical protein
MLRTKASVIDIYSSKILLWYNSTDMIFKKPIEVIVFICPKIWRHVLFFYVLQNLEYFTPFVRSTRTKIPTWVNKEVLLLYEVTCHDILITRVCYYIDSLLGSTYRYEKIIQLFSKCLFILIQ